MITRRRFLGGVAGLALGGPTVLEAAAADDRPRLADDPAHRRYRADMAGCEERTLGVPRQRSLVAQGFHPVTPGRVIVLDDGDVRRLHGRHGALDRLLQQEEARCRQRWPGEEPLPAVKRHLCLGLMDRLTAHYRRPDLFARWARTLFRREKLGSTGIGYGFGLLHDFQHPDHVVRTDNGIVDWWLVLLPGGVDWWALDGEPVYYMVGPVMEERKPGGYLRVMEAISRGLRTLVRTDGFDPAAWAGRLAGLPAADAARAFNYTVARGLTGGSRAQPPREAG